MSIAAQALALPRDFEFDGQTYQLKPLTYGAFAKFSLWVEERAKNAMLRSIEQGIKPDVAYGIFLDKSAAGHYEPGGQVFSDAIDSPQGKRKVLELMLTVPKGVSAADLSFAIYADKDAFDAACKLMAEVNSDPLVLKALRVPTSE